MKIQLYIRSGCPFCHKVLRAAERLGLKETEDFITVNAAPGEPGEKELIKKGGKSMVPFLVHGDTSMYESDDIIDYLEKQVAAKH